MAVNQVSGNSVNSSTSSPRQQTVDSVSKSRNGQQKGKDGQDNPYADQVSISGKATRLEKLSQELFTSLKPEAQVGDVAHKLYEHGFISLENLNHIPLETRTQKFESPQQLVSMLQGQAKELVLQGEDNATIEGITKLYTTLKNMTAPSYSNSAYQRVSGYGYVGIQ